MKIEVRESGTGGGREVYRLQRSSIGFDKPLKALQAKAKLKLKLKVTQEISQKKHLLFLRVAK